MVQDFIANGGDGYDMIDAYKRNHETGKCLNYLVRRVSRRLVVSIP